MNECVPIILGLLIGVIFHRAHSRGALTVAAALAAGGGVLASVVTGEIGESWAYAIYDAALVSAMAAASAKLVRRSADRLRRLAT